MPKTALIAHALCLLFIAISPAKAAEHWETLPPIPPMPAPGEQGLADVNGINIYYAIYGKGDPILFIHGGLGDAGIWANQIRDLSQDHEVIVADSRGHGRSTRDERPFSYDLMTDDYVALLDYLHKGPVTLVGWSDGGIIGINMAMKHPEKLTRLIAHAANINPEGVRADVLQNRTFQKYIERAGERYHQFSLTPDQYDDFVRQIALMWNSEPNWPESALAAIHVPVTIAIGDHDEGVKLEHTKMIAGAIPGAKLVILRNTSHFSMLQDPDGYNAVIREAIAGN
ncbi:alpha/beta fold hydrolase [Brucellaceae bacterium D45D]